MDVSPSDMGPVHQIINQGLDVLDHRVVQGVGAAGLPGMVDAADDVGAVLDLRVVFGGRLAGDSRGEIHQVRHHGGRAHVQGQAEIAV